MLKPSSNLTIYKFLLFLKIKLISLNLLDLSHHPSSKVTITSFVLSMVNAEGTKKSITNWGWSCLFIVKLHLTVASELLFISFLCFVVMDEKLVSSGRRICFLGFLQQPSKCIAKHCEHLSCCRHLIIRYYDSNCFAYHFLALVDSRLVAVVTNCNL